MPAIPSAADIKAGNVELAVASGSTANADLVTQGVAGLASGTTYAVFAAFADSGGTLGSAVATTLANTLGALS